MGVPDYQTLMLPLLKAIGDKKEHQISEVTYGELERQFKMSDAERDELNPSGTQTKFYNRVGWARTYLMKAGLLESTGWGTIRITPRGLSVLNSNPTLINNKFLEQFPEFREFKRLQLRGGDPEVPSQTPEDVIDSNYKITETRLAEDLLTRIKGCPPRFFENLVVELIRQMGYGVSGERVGRSGDEGIDGIINLDKLGLDVVCIQAKRWAATVPEKEVQAFASSLDTRKANKGVFITTSRFSDGALGFSKMTGKKLELIDGERLAKLMIEHNVGVAVTKKYELKKIDNDYFGEE
jgi:restriction system protein